VRRPLQLRIESGRSGDVDPKTGRFLLVNPAPTEGQVGPIRIVLNWDSDVERTIKPK